MKQLSERASEVHTGRVDPKLDNMCERSVTAIKHEENVTKAVTGVK